MSNKNGTEVYTGKCSIHDKFTYRQHICEIQDFDIIIEKNYNPKNVDEYIEILDEGFGIAKILPLAIKYFLSNFDVKDFLVKSSEELDALLEAKDISEKSKSIN